MNKTMLYLFITIGGGIGGYLPVLLGDSSMFSGWSILGSTIGSIVGIFVAKRLSDY
ncbi:hypothetical protein KBB49_03950 [Candidatus Saccharibacteria bacterium]|nr:hypothetical protein [Candidatus Saccharibacteria bacterium]